MQELKQTWDRIGPIWWLIIWRALAGSIAIGIFIGLLFSVLSIVSNQSFSSMVTTFAIARIVVAALILFVWWPNVMRMALKKKYHGFRIALVPTENSEISQGQSLTE